MLGGGGGRGEGVLLFSKTSKVKTIHVDVWFVLQCSCVGLKKYFILYFVDLLLLIIFWNNMSLNRYLFCLRLETRVLIFRNNCKKPCCLISVCFLSFFFYLLISWVHYFFPLFMHIMKLFVMISRKTIDYY